MLKTYPAACSLTCKNNDKNFALPAPTLDYKQCLTN